jgi:hypothetical protein
VTVVRLRASRVLTCLALALLLAASAVAPADAATPVERAQRRLNALGCDSGPVDGVLGEWTRSAVVRFQSRHGLAQSGRLDGSTVRRLYADSARRCDRRPVPAGSGEGRRIVLSQRQNWIWLVRRDGSVRAQGGIIDNPGVLAPGRYLSGSYCGRPARIVRNVTENGELYLDHFVRFAPCGVGFHRIPRRVEGGEQIHADWLLGTDYRASHGCIRLSRPMSQRVWRFTAAETRVRVV